MNPHTDILNPIPGGIGQTFQPAERMTAGEKEWTASNTRFEGGMGIDATMPRTQTFSPSELLIAPGNDRHDTGNARSVQVRMRSNFSMLRS